MIAYLTGSLNRYASVFGITLRKRRMIENNAQERELRSPVIKRKISFGSDSEEIARRFADLLSAVLTFEHQLRPSLPWLERLFRGRAPSLLPQHT